MVDSSACCEYNGSKIGNIDFLLTEILSRNTFNFDKGSKYHLYTMFLGKVVVRRFVGSRLGL